MARRIVARSSESSTKPCSRRSPKLVPWSTRCGGPVGILGITLQDLRFRARQFLIAVIGAGLVFAMGLLLSGMVAGLGNEITHTVESARADSWVLTTGASARIVALSTLPSSTVSLVASEPGVVRAEPIIVVPEATQIGTNADS